MNRLRRFFLPPSGSSRRRRLLSWGLVAGIPVFILLVIPPAWEYSNTAEFCGKTCHTMPPEYNTYLVSPHARVPCVDCHIGRDWIAKQLVRKSGHMRLIWATLTHSYEYPIRISEMRPARETCERCHYPEKFSDDSLRVVHRFADDEQNTPYDLYLLMHTGGGIQREGLGRGIHWHIENKIEYITTDKEEQDIPWIRVTRADGTTAEYVSTDSTIDTTRLDQYTIHEMDCITCHNRISHLIDTPYRLIDKALYRGDLPSDIPYIRARAVEVLSVDYASSADAKTAIAGLDQYYRDNYSDFYASNGEQIGGAIALLEQLYSNNTYTDQELDWKTHPNNIGHRDSQGCFRCHDGKHINAEQEVIRLECNLCHSIPQVVRPGEIEPKLPLTTGIEPASHLDSTWISRHHLEFNETCSNCHTIDNAGGTTDTSFCSNSGCHGVDWKFAGFNALLMAQELGIEQPPAAGPIPTLAAGEPITYQVLLPVLTQRCGQCHGAAPMKGLRLTDYASLMAGSENGPMIVPGSPDESKIVQVQEAGHFGQLTADEIALLRQWIADGAPEGEAVPSGEETAPSEAEPTATQEAGEGGFTWGASEPTATEAPAATQTPSATEAPSATETPSGASSFWGATPSPTAGEGGSFWGTPAGQ